MKIFAGITLLVVVAVITDCHPTEQAENNVENTKLGRDYELIYDAETWKDARDRCSQIGAKLAVPKSTEEFRLIQGIIRKMQFHRIKGCTGSKLVAWLGISNLDDYRVWRNVDGEAIKDTGFSTWSGSNGSIISDDPKEPHCAVLDAVNPGLRDYWCHLKQPFVCERGLNATVNSM